MRKNYEIPDMNISLFAYENVITASGDKTATAAENAGKAISDWESQSNQKVRAILTF